MGGARATPRVDASSHGQQLRAARRSGRAGGCRPGRRRRAVGRAEWPGLRCSRASARSPGRSRAVPAPILSGRRGRLPDRRLERRAGPTARRRPPGRRGARAAGRRGRRGAARRRRARPLPRRARRGRGRRRQTRSEGAGGRPAPPGRRPGAPVRRPRGRRPRRRGRRRRRRRRSGSRARTAGSPSAWPRSSRPTASRPTASSCSRPARPARTIDLRFRVLLRSGSTAPLFGVLLVLRVRARAHPPAVLQRRTTTPAARTSRSTAPTTARTARSGRRSASSTTSSGGATGTP